MIEIIIREAVWKRRGLIKQMEMVERDRFTIPDEYEEMALGEVDKIRAAGYSVTVVHI